MVWLIVVCCVILGVCLFFIWFSGRSKKRESSQLETIKQNIVKLQKYLRRNYSSYSPEEKTAIQRLQSKIPDLEILERPDDLENETSFTLDKEKIYICLRDPQTDVPYDDGLLSYVVLHELAHVLSPDIGHTQKFHQIFQFLIREARRCGIRVDTGGTQEYCGTVFRN